MFMIDDSEILRLWNEGMTVHAISKTTGYRNQTVKNHLEKMGIDPRRDLNGWTDEQDLRLIIGRNSGRTGKDLYSSVPGKSVAAGMHRLHLLRTKGRVR